CAKEVRHYEDDYGYHYNTYNSLDVW
nr:immunoglobulin heavy chain junction region [Macaca mulatta]MOV42151.1 immunoglobulin heavy chain junction region [Macaca mulatta]